MDGADLPRSIDRNLGIASTRTFTLAGSDTTFPYHFYGANRPFTNFTRVIGFEASAESRYHGLTLELNQRLADHLQYRAAYTLGKVEDTVPDATAVVPGNAGDDMKYASNPTNFDADRTAGNNDQRHRLVVSASTTRTASIDCRDSWARSSGTGRSASSSRRSPASRTRRASVPST